MGSCNTDDDAGRQPDQQIGIVIVITHPAVTGGRTPQMMTPVVVDIMRPPTQVRRRMLTQAIAVAPMIPSMMVTLMMTPGLATVAMLALVAIMVVVLTAIGIAMEIASIVAMPVVSAPVMIMIVARLRGNRRHGTEYQGAARACPRPSSALHASGRASFGHRMSTGVLRPA